MIFSNITKKAMPLLTVVALLIGCSELEDKDHYGDSSTQINSEELQIVNQSSEDYLKSTAEYSKMSQFLEDEGVYNTLNSKGQLSTILVVENDDFVEPTGDADDTQYLAYAHVSDASVSPANLKSSDMRLLMWHGKYINIDLDDAAKNDGLIAGHIMFNTSGVKKVIKTNSGYIYVLTNMINTPQSLNDFINALDDNYSILRDTIKASGGKEFDKANSKAIGINAEGNTVYDTVWIYTNTHFEEQGVDLTSESLTATMLLMSNGVIEAAIADARDRAEKWDLLDRWSSDREHDFEYTMRHWIMDVAFFSKKYTALELSSTNEDDNITSIFSKVWKPAKQTIDPEMTELSNAYVYNVKKLHIPNNIIIYRLKEEFFPYEYCTSDQKDLYFQFTNAKFKNVNTDVTAWSPLSGVWPYHQNRVLIITNADTNDKSGEWTLIFTPIKCVYDKYYTRAEWAKKTDQYYAGDFDGASSVKECLIPPGKYRLGMGFKQNANQTINVAVYANGKQVAMSDDITLGSATTYHYDRTGSYFPEGYDPNDSRFTGSKNSYYDCDGGEIIKELEIPDVYGNGSAVSVKFYITSTGWNQQTSFTLNHWCLRPTKDNY